MDEEVNQDKTGEADGMPDGYFFSTALRCTWAFCSVCGFVCVLQV